MLHVEEGEKGHPKPPSRQLVATWVVETWEEIPEELLKQGWITAGYRTMEELKIKKNYSNFHQITPYSRDDIVALLDPIDGGESTFHYLNAENKYSDYWEEDETAGWDIQQKKK